MAIVQISQITNRKGLAENLPQLAGAELGWSIDTRQLYIGNGTLEEGAPVIGNTEILTEFSDILNFTNTYTYKGEAAGYTVQTGATLSTPVTQSLQSWLDQYASVKDFGAVGDGQTDDTEAINRALFQLYCREVNPQIRRSLFFPAGVYVVSDTINIPPYATLVGEGPEGSVITLFDQNGTVDYVAQTADSLQQTGVNVGSNGAIPPQYITVTNLGFSSLDPVSNIFVVTAADDCRFQNVLFQGPRTTTDLTSPAPATAAVNFASTPSLVTEQITFDGCTFSGVVYGVYTDQQIQGVTFTACKFDTMFNGVVLGAGTPVLGGATGTRIMGNMFDNIYAEGIIFGDVSLNASGHNIFYDVGNHFSGSTGTPATAIIDIQSANNLSVSDLFERTDDFALEFPRIQLNGTTSIATTNGSQLSMGTYTRESGQLDTLVNNNTGTVFELNATLVRAFCVNYTIVRNFAYRTGTIMVATDVGDSSLGITSSDDYVENDNTGISLSVDQASDTVSLLYTATNTGINATMTYSITYLA
jgi:hypothetical protein